MPLSDSQSRTLTMPVAEPPLRPRAAASSAVELPAMLGRYRLLEHLGHGGMGEVYRALHINLGQTVALKTLRLAGKERPSEEAVARFYREMEAVGSLLHPHVVRATDAGEESDVHYLVMEFVDGCDAAHLLTKCGLLSVPDACEVGRQAALGLAYVATRGLVHRDIKPSNLLISADGVVKIADLGLARFRAASDEGDLTVTGQMIGTVDYMAPEQAVRPHDTDIRADLYSLGGTLLKLTTGQPPFPSTQYSSVYDKLHAHQVETPHFSAVRSLSPPLAALIEQLLAKAPHDRPPSADEVAQRLEPLARGHDLRKLVSHVLSLKTALTTANSAAAGASIRSDLDTQSHAEHGSTWRSNPPTRSRWALLGTALLGLVVVLAYVVVSRARHDEGPAPPVSASVPAPTPPVSASVGAPTAQVVSSPSETKKDVGDQVEAPVTRDEPVPAPVFDLDSQPPLQWQRLFVRRPTEFLWYGGDGLSTWNFDTGLQQVTARTRESGMLELGQTSAPRFTLQLGVSQTRWVGGIGVYFGCRPITETTFRFQFIEFRQQMSRGAKRLSLVRGRGIRSRPSQPEDEVLLNASSFPAEFAGEVILEITIADGGAKRVRLDGLRLDELTTNDANQGLVAADYHGTFGLFVNSSEAVFRNGQFMILREFK